MEKKFSDKPKWIKLHEDKHLDLLDNDDFPGSVLLQLGVGTDAEWDEAESSWKDSVAQMQHRTPYELRVHIFQVTPRRGRQPLIDVVFEPNAHGHHVVSYAHATGAPPSSGGFQWHARSVLESELQWT